MRALTKIDFDFQFRNKRIFKYDATPFETQFRSYLYVQSVPQVQPSADKHRNRAFETDFEADSKMKQKRQKRTLTIEEFIDFGEPK